MQFHLKESSLNVDNRRTNRNNYLNSAYNIASSISGNIFYYCTLTDYGWLLHTFGQGRSNCTRSKESCAGAEPKHQSVSMKRDENADSHLW